MLEPFTSVHLVSSAVKWAWETNLFTKQKQTHRLREGTYGYGGQGGRSWGGNDWEFGTDVYTLLYLK